MPRNVATELSFERLMSLLDSPCETASLDFKETVDLSQGKGRVELAKDVLAMANSGGGHIVVGVEDTSRRPVGIGDEVSVTLRDAKTVNDKLTKYCGGFIKVLVAHHEIQKPEGGITRLAAIYVPGSSFKVPAQSDGAYPDPANPARQIWTFRKGDVYVRKGDESVKVETPEDLQPAKLSPELGIEVAREIIRSYGQRLQESFSDALPDLRSSEASDEMCGYSLIGALLKSKDFMLLGPSGSGKSLHLKHLSLAALKQNELPLHASGGRYKGESILDFIDHGVAPFSAEDTQTLCEAAVICGVSVVLVIDGLNECQPYLQNLARELSAFRLRHPIRLIVTAQEDDLPAVAIGCERVAMMPLTTTHKRFVYCYHAKMVPTADVDYLCQGFSNGYDLAVAGRCHNKRNSSFMRVELYDRYCRESLPQFAETVLTALLRTIASRMGEEVTNFWPRFKFEQHAEEFLSAQGCSLSLLDQLKSCRLISLTDDSFSFEHELLFDYFRAEQVRRDFAGCASLAAELARPKNQSLFPFVLSRQTDPNAMRNLFTAILRPETLREVIIGRCGEPARQALIEDCKGLYNTAAADLSKLSLRFTQDVSEPGPRSLASIDFDGLREWTQYELRLLDAIAMTLDDNDLQQGFLDLLDLTRWTLRSKAEQIASESGTTFNKVWSIIVGQIWLFASKQLPLMRITARLRENLMQTRRRERFSLEDQLWAKVSRDSRDHLSIAILLDVLTYSRSECRDLDMCIEVARAAWESKIYHLRLNALHLLHSIRWVPLELQPEEIKKIRELVTKFEAASMFLNSSLLEVQTSYGVWEQPVSDNEAIMEMKSVIAEVKAESRVGRKLRNRAYGLLSNLFEDIYQGAYDRAYESLESDEKATILSLAAQSEGAGFSTNWILHELLRHGREPALPIFKHFASSIDEDSNSPQEAAAAYAIAIKACARFMDEPPIYTGPSTAEHRAWQIVGKILFWACRGRREPLIADNRLEGLWEKLSGDLGLAAIDVVYAVQNGLSLFYAADSDEFNLPRLFPTEVKGLLEHGLTHRHSLTSVFSCFSRLGDRNETLAFFIIEELGRIGNETTIPMLHEISDDPRLGTEAVAAIRRIRESTLSR